MIASLLLSVVLSGPAAEAARVKDVAGLYGVRDNALLGYGLVTGLNRTGDSRRNEATIRALTNRLQGLGFTISTEEILARNVAVVMVTGRLPASARPGHKLDVEVSSTGDATSLEGGVLQLTPLFAPNGEAFASCQGPLVVGGFLAEAGASTSRKNHPTVGRVPQGAIVERENPNRISLTDRESLEWVIDEPDFTTALRLSEAINATFEAELAGAIDAATVTVEVPARYRERVVEFVAQIEHIEVQADSPARVVLNERTGTLVMGADVRIAPVAVAHGGLSIEVSRDSEVDQPAPFSAGRTVVTRQAQITVEESDGELKVVDGATIADLVSALNSIGVKPRDLIQILLTIRAAGALQAELEVL